MRPNYVFASLTRISDLATRHFDVAPIDRSAWEDGDYVVGRVLDAGRRTNEIELVDGRQTEVVSDDLVVGALGRRAATLGAVGDWTGIREDGVMHTLTGAGLLGTFSSRARFSPTLVPLKYMGHVLRSGRKVAMADFVPHRHHEPFRVPTILIIGTSMSAGKTTTARVLARQLRRGGSRVAGAKLSGAGRYKDILAMRDSGAEIVFDFVDVGLPSSIVPRERFRAALRQLLGLIAAKRPEVMLAEAGASPLEPYNGDVVLEELREHICCVILCAMDPYAVYGVREAFGVEPDIVTGPAASTSAGVELVEKLTGLRAVNVLRTVGADALVETARRCLNEARAAR